MYARYAYTLANIFTTMMFASAIPVLLLLNFFQCGLVYWCDKYLFVSFYKKPGDLGPQVNRRAFDILYWCAVFSIGFSLWILTCPDIYPTNTKTFQMEVAGEIVVAIAGKSSSFFQRIIGKNTIAVLLALLVILGVNVLKIFIGFLVYIFTCCCKKTAKPFAVGKPTFKESQGEMSKLHICSYRLDANPDYIRIFKAMNKQSFFPTHILVEEHKSKQDLLESYSKVANQEK